LPPSGAGRSVGLDLGVAVAIAFDTAVDGQVHGPQQA